MTKDRRRSLLSKKVRKPSTNKSLDKITMSYQTQTKVCEEASSAAAEGKSARPKLSPTGCQYPEVCVMEHWWT